MARQSAATEKEWQPTPGDIVWFLDKSGYRCGLVAKATKSVVGVEVAGKKSLVIFRWGKREQAWVRRHRSLRIADEKIIDVDWEVIEMRKKYGNGFPDDFGVMRERLGNDKKKLAEHYGVAVGTVRSWRYLHNKAVAEGLTAGKENDTMEIAPEPEPVEVEAAPPEPKPVKKARKPKAAPEPVEVEAAPPAAPEPVEEKAGTMRYKFEAQHFAKMLVKAREAKGISMAQAAREAGITISGLSRLEKNGRVPKVDTFFKLYEVYGKGFSFYFSPPADGGK